jgi:hypothetical protein
VKERCVWCDEGWERPDETPRHPCPRCGRTEWDMEPNYTNLSIAEWGEYEILAETSDFHRVFWLDLRGVMMTGLSARVPLSHRLKNTYRKQMDDLRSKDARGLIITFSKPRGPQGQWEIALKRPWSPPPNPFLHSHSD